MPPKPQPLESLTQVDSRSIADATEHTRSFSTAPVAESPPDVGVTLLPERLDFQRVLGHGAFGAVILARDKQLDRLVAIKSPRSARSSPVDIAHMLAEARLASQVRHPAVVTIFDVLSREDGSLLVLQEYLPGGTLRDRMNQGPLPPGEAARLVAELAGGLAAIHAKGIVHRDLKPTNVLFDESGRPRIVDFGLALDQDVQHQRRGEISGSAPYMSPEQARGDAHHLDGRTDIWSLGVILYELLTGRRPFDGTKWDQLFDEISSRHPRPIRQTHASVPVELEQICLKCLEKDVRRRYSTAEDLAVELEQFLATYDEAALSGSSTRRRIISAVAQPPAVPWIAVIPRWSIFAAIFALAVLIAAAWPRLFHPPGKADYVTMSRRESSR